VASKLKDPSQRLFRLSHARAPCGTRSVADAAVIVQKDEDEAAFADALRALGFEELVGPGYGGCFDVNGKAPNYKGSQWINHLFLLFLRTH
jgi:hypothetical protein